MDFQMDVKQEKSVNIHSNNQLYSTRHQSCTTLRASRITLREYPMISLLISKSSRIIPMPGNCRDVGS